MDLVTGAQTRLRDRRLAGDERAGSWARQTAGRRELDFVRDRWLWLLSGYLGAGVVIAGVALIVPAGFLRGLFVGASGAGFIALTAMLVMQVTGSTSTRMGATAEQWTASELRHLQPHGWHLINHLKLEREIDHLLVGPAGVIAVETKWRRSAWTPDHPDSYLEDALRQVKASAKNTAEWGLVKDAKCSVRPVLVLWDSEPVKRPKLPERGYWFVSGVTVIMGRESARRWRQHVFARTRALDNDSVQSFATAARAQVKYRDALEEPPLSLPPIGRIYWTTLGCLIAAIVGVLAISEPITHRWAWLTVLPVGAAVAVGLLLRRVRRLRVIGDALLAGVVGTALVGSVLALLM